MSNEVELKLAVTSDAFDILKTHLNQFNILEQNTIFLGNTYFDYPDHFLANKKWDCVSVGKITISHLP